MFFRQVLNEDLGCASYVIADGGEAIVVDPQWNVDEYLELARRHGFRITVVGETHTHADHVSGRARLAAATGASVAVPRGSEMHGADRLLADGDVIDVGSVRLTAVATPGHRPEHLSLLVQEGGRDSLSTLLLTGDSLLVGDVARPDLAAGSRDAAEGAAGALFRSLQRLLELDDLVEIWPGHLGSSLCGGGQLSSRSSSTLGYERRTNRMLAIENEQLFTRRLLASLPDRPPHVARTVELNRREPGSVEHESPQSPLSAIRVRKLVRSGATLIDGREPEEFDVAHIPRSLNVPSARAGFATRCASLADPDLDTIVLGRDNAEALRMVSLLEGVGFTSVRGFLRDGLAGWSRGGCEFHTVATPAVGSSEAAALLAAGSATVLDVRDLDEWERGHVAGSLHIPWAQLPGRLDEVRAVEPRPIIVACASGFRAALAASLLRAHNVRAVRRLRGGVAPETGSPTSAIQYARTVAAAGDTRRTAARR